LAAVAAAGPPPAPAEHKGWAGVVYGAGAYTLWGVFPLYFHALSHVSPMTILCHRIVWSALFMGVLVTARQEWTAVGTLACSARNLWLLITASILLALNWLIFIYAVGTHQVLEASLGYFINPIVSIALGMLFLRERLRRRQWIAVTMAVAAMGYLAAHRMGVPWIPISLALTFGLYGLVRKKLNVHSLHALLIESIVLTPIAVVTLGFFSRQHLSGGTFALLSLSGVITAIPLIMFGAALRRLRLATMGFLQYIGPTLQFTVAVALLGEPLDGVRLKGFALCWAAIAVYVLDSISTKMADRK